MPARFSPFARISARQLVLFLLSMVVPCVVLVGLGVRMIVQQEELAEKHIADQRRLRANEFERALIARLERLEQNPSDPSVALVATLADGRLVLPWDAEPRSDPAADAAFGAILARAEREEFGGAHLDLAESELRAALKIARTEQQRAYARLARARVLANCCGCGAMVHSGRCRHSEAKPKR